MAVSILDKLKLYNGMVLISDTETRQDASEISNILDISCFVLIIILSASV